MNDGHTHHHPDMHGHAEPDYSPRMTRRGLILGESPVRLWLQSRLLQARQPTRRQADGGRLSFA